MIYPNVGKGDLYCFFQICTVPTCTHAHTHVPNPIRSITLHYFSEVGSFLALYLTTKNLQNFRFRALTSCSILHFQTGKSSEITCFQPQTQTGMGSVYTPLPLLFHRGYHTCSPLKQYKEKHEYSSQIVKQNPTAFLTSGVGTHRCFVIVQSCGTTDVIKTAAVTY